ncbi:MAG TPA: DUF222 domain-containing protein [Actinomycetes bacterium]
MTDALGSAGEAARGARRVYSSDPLLDAVEAAVDGLQASDPSLLGGAPALGDRIVRLETLLARLSSHQVACIGVFDARGDAQACGARSSQAWLRRRARLSPGEASARVGLARRIKHYVGTATAFAAGRIRSRHAEVITRTLDEITPALNGEQAVAELEATMVDAARVVDPLRLASRCRRLRDAVAPQQAVAEDWDAFTARHLSLSRTIGGMIAIGGMLDPLTGETVLAGLYALAAPAGPDDDRTPRQRRADALGELARRVLTLDPALPSVGGERPQVLVTVDLPTLERRAADAAAATLPGLTTPGLTTPGRSDPPRCHPGPLLGQSGKDQAGATVVGSAPPRSAPPGSAAGRESTNTARGAAAAGQAYAGGALDRLGRLPGAELAWAGPISGELARRICCDAMITRVVTDGASQPLDVGRLTRVVPAGMRRALLVRDRHCQYPGCDTPGQWCDAHHLDHWALGGATKLANLVLLCPYHHTRLHLSGHWPRRQPDGTLELITDGLPDHHAEPPGGT